jgi:mRNA interferase MazF
MTGPVRGEIWMADLDPARGHEQAGTRPGLVVSSDGFNASPAGLVIILPLTSQEKGIRSHVELSPPEGGLRKRSFIKCEDIRSISVERLTRRLGRVSPATMAAVAFRLRILIEL